MNRDWSDQQKKDKEAADLATVRLLQIEKRANLAPSWACIGTGMYVRTAAKKRRAR